MEKVFDETNKKMLASLEAYRRELAKLRTGRASLAILEDIKVEYYGTLSPLNQIATLGVPDPRTITIQPWDVSVVQSIEKAIMKSELGLNPVNDGRVIRLPIPPLNEERRKDLVKIVKKYAEECKLSVRNARRDANDALKKMKDSSAITEDNFKKGQERIQKLTDDLIHKIDETASHKEKDIMEV